MAGSARRGRLHFRNATGYRWYCFQRASLSAPLARLEISDCTRALLIIVLIKGCCTRAGEEKQKKRKKEKYPARLSPRSDTEKRFGKIACENEFSFRNRYRVFFSITHSDCQLATSVTAGRGEGGYFFPRRDQIYALALRQMRKNGSRLFRLPRRMVRCRRSTRENTENKRDPACTYDARSRLAQSPCVGSRIRSFKD